MERDTVLRIILGLSIVGLGVAAYQTYEHYFLTTGMCDLSSTFSCSVVTESRFGEFPPNSGIATAAWGMAWWLGVAALSYTEVKGGEWLENQEFYLFSYIAGGMVFVVYLLVVELYILPAETGALIICPFCTVQHVIILALLPLSYIRLAKPLKTYIEDVFSMEA